MGEPPSLMLDTSAAGQRIRYDATLCVQMQVQLHRKLPNGTVKTYDVPRKCPFR